MTHEELQRLIDSVSPSGGEIVIPPGYHEIRRPINLRGRRNLTLRGTGPASVLVASLNNDRFGRAPAIDATGAISLRIRGLRINGPSDNPPWCGMLLARNEAGDSAGMHLFDDLFFDGCFRFAAVYSIASECNRWIGCSFVNVFNAGASVGGLCYVATDEDRIRITPRSAVAAAIDSPFGPAGPRRNNSMEHGFLGCWFAAYGDDSNDIRSLILLTQGVTDVGWYRCSFSAKVSSHSVFRIERNADRPDGNSLAACRIENCRFETSGARNWMWSNTGISHVTILDNTIECRQSAIFVTEQQTVDRLWYDSRTICRQPTDWTNGRGNRPIISAWRLHNSQVDWCSNFNKVCYTRPGLAAPPYYADRVVEIRDSVAGDVNNRYRIDKPSDVWRPSA